MVVIFFGTWPGRSSLDDFHAFFFFFLGYRTIVDEGEKVDAEAKKSRLEAAEKAAAEE
jgi:hypothetical protein